MKMYLSSYRLGDQSEKAFQYFKDHDMKCRTMRNGDDVITIE
ncbi:MAG: hypothetical protein QNL12_01120 [Acidimicrobiia bacterium]|nr:hypothetical protein [Acidimicrobiia bacterium]MDX2465887.1 hypothetical protein [Acidimicrobiia bacterium]